MPQTTYVVGLGASAGGIPALKAFFSQAQDTPDTAFVVVTHLSPTRESLLHEVISHFTKLPVEVIKDGDPVRPGVVHVLPEGNSLSISDGRLRLLKTDPALRERKPIDVFFSALAIDQQEHAVGIVLAGGDHDGTIGVRAIKEHGGITFAQLTGSNGPEHSEMPESAVASGYVDFVLPPEQIPNKLLELQKAAAAIGAELRRGELDTTEAERKRLQGDICELLRNHSGRDFAGYKVRTFFRRVARRMQVVQTTNPEAYLERLRNDPTEVMALFRDLLISVTAFFRDEDAFEALSVHVMPSLLANRGTDDTVRLWVPGCATGEEAYSLAILIREHMDGFSASPTVKVFATDIDTHALRVARAGRYPGPLLKNVSDERKARFFRQDGESWVIGPEIRDMCIFSAHSLTGDPPFAQMDLVSCRNLLIYLGTELQQRVIPILHYALNPGGFLFLGNSESLGKNDNLFAVIDKKHRIFKSLDLGDRRPRIPIQLYEFRKKIPQNQHNDRLRGAITHRVQERAQHQILERHSPAHVVVRSDGTIIFFSARNRQYFETPRGAPSQHLFDLVRRELRQDLRSALRESLETGKPILRRTVLPEDDAALNVEMVVEPLNNSEIGETQFLVVFRSFGKLPFSGGKAGQLSAAQADADASERELRELNERLSSTIEQYETALEELSASNEELVSVNEEAQSGNEELQASKEEMQSLNEELSAVNAQLSDKVDELERVNTDLSNLYDATGISSIFLDKEMMIRNFTPAAAKFFKLRKPDIGRPLTELASTVEYPELEGDILQVFKTGKPVEHKLPGKGAPRQLLLRANPYLDGEVITGVVVTFLDVTDLIQAEEQRAVLIAEAAEQSTRLKVLVDADARKARLMAVLAHDLRTPLVAILSSIDLLRDDTTKEAMDIIVHRLQQEGHGMLNLIDDVLALAKLNAGEIRLRPEPFAPMELLVQVGNLVQPAADRNGTQVDVHADSMPILLGDLTALRRILLNFATNAVKATRGGSVQLSATLDVTGPTGNTVTFSVSDNGCGIASEDIPRLFRDFGMLERDGTNQEGTGLGLAICRRLASAIGAELGVESTLGKGSRFWLNVTLPEADSAVPVSDDVHDDPAAVLAGMRVLVAEDHEMIRQLTCVKLASIGMLPTEAADGEIAVSLAEAEEFDMILMDMHMPSLDGDKAAALIRRGGGPSARALIIGFTAHQPPQIAVMLSNLAFDGCLRKPLDLQQLAALAQGVAPAVPELITTESFDNKKLRELREIDGGALLSRTLKSFSAEIEAVRIQLPILIGKRDTFAMGRLVHKLIGVCDVLGAQTLSAELRKFVVLIRAGDIEALKAAIDLIDDVMIKTGAHINQISAGIGQS
ncbi:CheR family methyltransferase [Yoonia sp.]|uniref:CheR family methyltransferase n=1 Tax=Yoonia sp. TaxID=2212373 RepID=UPI002E036D08|nr:CheR family methyltransferase [Yoonia sp.]